MSVSKVSGQEISAPDHLPSRTKPHLAYLDGLRAVAMLWVLFNHAYSSAFNAYEVADMGNTPHWLYTPLSILNLGHYAVDIFISLSGFCLALPVVLKGGELRGGAMEFYRRRAWRILPPYYISMIFAVALTALTAGLGDLDAQAARITTWGVVTHLLLIQDLFRQTHAQINGVLWTVSVEWRIYFLFPLIIWSWRKIGPGMTTLLTVILSYILFAGLVHLKPHFPMMADVGGVGICPNFIGLFAIGTLGAYLAFSEHPRMQTLRKLATSPWTALALGVLVAGVTALHWFPVHNGVLTKIAHLTSAIERRDLLVGLWATAIMVAAGKYPNHWSLRPLSARPLVFLGTFAYSTYLIHAPVLILIRQIVRSVAALPLFQLFLLEATVGVAVAIGVSYLFHLAFERPFMSKPGQSAPRTERQAEVAAIVNPAP